MQGLEQTDFFQLIPEVELMKQLSPRWQQRFKKAIYFMLSTVPTPAWEEVANHCAISPYHFHRLFKSVFHETPQQYIRRTHLQLAIHYLIQSNDSVTDIAQRCAFSSSQALAKALKRELGLNAKQIRAMQNSWDLESMRALFARLGHPTNDDHCLEAKLTEQLVFDKVDQPALLLTTRSVSPPSTYKIMKAWKNYPADVNDLFMVMPIQENYKAWNEQSMQVGFVQTSSGNYELPAGQFVSCRFTVISEVGYFMAWDALYQYVMFNDWDINEQAHTFEIIHDIKRVKAEPYKAAEMTLYLPIQAI